MAKNNQNEQDDWIDVTNDWTELPSEQLIEDSEKIKTDKLRALLSGAKQGLTLGFADEAEAKVAELLSRYVFPEVLETSKKLKDIGATGDIGPTSPEEVYKEELQKAREERKLLETESPGTYALGELAGGVAIPLGSVSKLGKGARALAGIKPSTSLKVAKETGKLVPELAGRAVQYGTEGALIGGLYGVGQSEKVEPSDIIGEGLSGAKTGALVGATLGPAMSVAEDIFLGKAGKPLSKSKLAEEHPLIRQMSVAKEMAEEGKTLFGESNLKKIRDIETKNINELQQMILDAKNKFGQEIDNALELATKEGVNSNELFENVAKMSGVKLSPSEVTKEGVKKIKLTLNGQEILENTQETIKRVQELNPLIDKTDLNKIQNLLNKYGRLTDLTPVEVRNYRNEINETLGKVKDISSKKILENLENQTSGFLQQIPGFREATQKYSSFMSALPEQLFAGPAPSKVAKKYWSDQTNPQYKLINEIGDMLENLQIPGSSSEERKKTLEFVKQNLSEFESKYPGSLSKTNIKSIDNLISTINKGADLSSIKKQFLQEQNYTIPGIEELFRILSGGGSTGRSIALGLASRVGQVQNLSRNIYNLPKDRLLSLSQKLKSSQSKVTQNFGGALEKAINEGNVTLKNASLFALLQNPESRKLLSDINEDEQE